MLDLVINLLIYIIIIDCGLKVVNLNFIVKVFLCEGILKMLLQENDLMDDDDFEKLLFEGKFVNENIFEFFF